MDCPLVSHTSRQIWLKVTTPTRLERALVVLAQAAYVTFYSATYALAPTFAHRLTGYLEEVAVQAYTDYLAAIDKGAIPNGPAPDIAKLYYRLPENATIRDVVLHVRADECMVRCPLRTMLLTESRMLSTGLRRDR